MFWKQVLKRYLRAQQYICKHASGLHLISGQFSFTYTFHFIANTIVSFGHQKPCTSKTGCVHHTSAHGSWHFRFLFFPFLLVHTRLRRQHWKFPSSQQYEEEEANFYALKAGFSCKLQWSLSINNWPLLCKRQFHTKQRSRREISYTTLNILTQHTTLGWTPDKICQSLPMMMTRAINDLQPFETIIKWQTTAETHSFWAQDAQTFLFFKLQSQKLRNALQKNCVVLWVPRC